jgi:hypothetical protein
LFTYINIVDSTKRILEVKEVEGSRNCYFRLGLSVPQSCICEDQAGSL